MNEVLRKNTRGPVVAHSIGSSLVLVCVLLGLLVTTPARGNMGVQPILPGGSSIKPEGETPIFMAAEKVVLNVRPATEVDDTVVTRNLDEYGLPGSFDGSTGMYPAMADVFANFTMVNPTTEAVSMTAWFPLASALETEEWNLNPGEVVPRIERFQVIMDGKPLEYKMSEQPNPKGEDKPPLPWASFPVIFPPRQETNVQISYVVPAWWDYWGLAMNLYYVFQTGAGWSGPIRKAELVVNLPYPASAETIWTMPEAGQIEGHQVRWIWENFEPGPQDDFFIQLLLLVRWDELQAARAAVAANPRDGEAWLNLASIYRTLTRGRFYGAARMLPGFGETYQPLGVRAAQEALRLLPGDGRPHYELAIFYLSALPKNPSPEELQPVLDELKYVDELSPELAPDVHDTFELVINTDPSAEWISWSDYWAAETATAALMPRPSTTPTPKITLTSTPIPSPTLQPLPTAPPTPTVIQPVIETSSGQSLIKIVAASLIGLVIVGYLLLIRMGGHASK